MKGGGRLPDVIILSIIAVFLFIRINLVRGWISKPQVDSRSESTCGIQDTQIFKPQRGLTMFNPFRVGKKINYSLSTGSPPEAGQPVAL